MNFGAGDGTQARDPRIKELTERLAKTEGVATTYQERAQQQAQQEDAKKYGVFYCNPS